MRVSSASILLAFAAAAWLPSAASAQGSSANQLKAAIVYNVIKFVTFPAHDPGAPLDFCVSHGVLGIRELAALEGQRAGNRPIQFRLVDHGAAAGCEIVYLGSSAASDIARVRQQGVLVMGESPQFVRAGGIVGVVRMGNQIRFEVNARAARQAKLQISSKLLRLAARVQQ